MYIYTDLPERVEFKTQKKLASARFYTHISIFFCRFQLSRKKMKFSLWKKRLLLVKSGK